MKKLSLVLLCGVLAGTAHAQSSSPSSPSDPAALRDLLEQVAVQSNVGTPRAINEELVDQGYTVKDTTLVNLIGVRGGHAAEMRKNGQQVRQQLQQAVCSNDGFRKLLSLGADLRYDFIEDTTNKPIVTERFQARDCGL